MELETEVAVFFDFRIGEIDDAEAVQEGNDAIADGGDGDFVPVVLAFIANRFDKFVVGAEPSASRKTGTAGGVPNGGFFTVSGDFVLATAEEPRRVDFVSAEVERAIHAAFEDVIDFRDEVGVRNMGDDETVARFRIVVLTNEDAVVSEAPAFGYEGVRVDDFPAVVAFDEEGFPFADAEILNADVLPADGSLICWVNLEPEETCEIFVSEDIGDGNAVEPRSEGRTDRLNFEGVPVVGFVRFERRFQDVVGGIVEPDATFLMSSAAFVIDARGVGIAGRDFALITEDAVGVRDVAAELHAGVAGNVDFEVELQNEVAVRLS